MPTSSPPNPLDTASRLVGRLDADGTASLEIDSSSLIGGKFNSMKAALREAGKSSGNNTSGGSETTSDQEDYDSLSPYPQAVIGIGRSMYGAEEPMQNKNKTSEQRNSGGARPRLESTRSIPIILKKADKKGKYTLTADDAELKKLLQMGIARVNGNTRSFLLLTC